MNDLDLFKAIVRAVSGIETKDVGKAIAKVRALLAPASAELSPERKSTGGRNRMYVGGVDRSAGDDEA